MKLSIPERLVLLKVLPQEGNFATLKVLSNLRLALSFSEDEIKEWGIKVDFEKGQTSWATNGEAEIPIGETATGVIVDALRGLDKQRKLTFEDVSVYEKFIPTTE